METMKNKEVLKTEIVQRCERSMHYSCMGGCGNCNGDIIMVERPRYEYVLLLDFIRHEYRNNPLRKDESNERDVLAYLDFLGGENALEAMKDTCEVAAKPL